MRSFFLLGLVCLFSAVTVRAQDTLRIGATLPLTGAYAYIGTAMQRGMELALKEFPQGQLKIWYEDEGEVERARAVAGFYKLFSSQKVQVVLGSTINSITAYAPIAQRNHVPVISLWDSNQAIEAMGDYAFSTGFSTEGAGELMASFAAGTLKLQKLAVVSANDEWSEIISEAFVRKLAQLGSRAVVHEIVNITDSDLRSVLGRVKASGAQAIYAPLYLSSLHAVIRQSRELGFGGPILVGDGMVEEDARQLGPAAEGVYATEIWLENKEFDEKYRRHYGENPSQMGLSFIAMGYDAVKMLGRVRDELVARKAGLSSQAVRNGIAGLDYQGVTGHFVFHGRRSIGQQETVVVVRNGNFNKYEQNVPSTR